MAKRIIASGALIGVGAAALSFALTGPVAAEDKLNIVFTHHSSASNPFWQAVKRASTTLAPRSRPIAKWSSPRPKVRSTRSSYPPHPPYHIFTFLGNLKDAKAKGVIVIASNVDATEGPELELRQAFVGQNFVPCRDHARPADGGFVPEGGPDPGAARRQLPRPELVGAARQGDHERARGVQEGQSEPRDHD